MALILPLGAFLGLLLLALFGDRIAPHEPIYFVIEHGADSRPYDPGVVFPLGSDVLGRDLLSLVLAGARTTLTIAVLGGIARVAAGVLIAAVSRRWSAARTATDLVAELVAAVPATLVALVLVKVFVKGDTTVWMFIGALLVLGWVGPYRVVRAEVDRLAQAPFTQGALAAGVGARRLFLRHHLPHLVPVIAVNLSQQVVASLVLIAELGVLTAFVGGTRLLNVEESMSVVRTGVPGSAIVTDTSEWGGLLASARTVEALWTTRWLVLVPGVAFALTAVSVAAIGFSLARRYARRDATEDVRSRRAVGLVTLVVFLVVVSAVLPERYAAAREWASATRGELRPESDSGRAFADAGLMPVGLELAIRHGEGRVVQTGPASVRIGSVSVTETFPRQTSSAGAFGGHAKAFVTSTTGGGAVEAPLVYAARGITPSEHPFAPSIPRIGLQNRELGFYIQDYPDDYAGIDVRGKVVLLVRFVGIAALRTYDAQGRIRARSDVHGIGVDASIEKAITKGAAAVIFVDPSLPGYVDVTTTSIGAGMNPYVRLEREAPPRADGGIPVVIVSGTKGVELAAAIGVDIPTAFMDFETPGSFANTRSAARDIGITARVEVPLERQNAAVTSVIGEVPGIGVDVPRVLLWALKQSGTPHQSRDVLAALARVVVPQGAPFIFAEYDPAAGPGAAARDIAPLLKSRPIGLVVVVQQVDGTALNFVTPHGELIPAFDLYASRSGARYEVTRSTASINALSGVAPLADVPTVIVKGVGGFGDLRVDAAGLLGYLAGRLALGAEELRR